MKIPFLPLHIVKTWVLDKKKQELDEMCENFYAIRDLASGVIPEMEQLQFALCQARMGRSAYGRRKARRVVERKAQKLKAAMEEAA